MPSEWQDAGQKIKNQKAAYGLIAQSVEMAVLKTDSVVKGMSNEIRSTLASPLSQVQEVHAFEYTGINGKDYALPMWGIKSGYGLDGQLNNILRFSETQNYTYNPEEISTEIGSAKEKALEKGNKVFLDFLRGVQPYPINSRGFVSEKPLSDYYNSFFKYETKVYKPKGEVLQVTSGLGSDPSISKKDLIKQ